MTPEVFIWGCPGEYGAYRAAVTRAGGRSRLSRDLSAADGCCALLLPGGGDLEPWRYGQPDTACRGTDPARDAAELTLLERFTGAGKPILGICRGLQVINVFFGGTLVQDFPGHSQTGGTDRLHRVRSASSPLRGAVGGCAGGQQRPPPGGRSIGDGFCALSNGPRTGPWRRCSTADCRCGRSSTTRSG